MTSLEPSTAKTPREREPRRAAADRRAQDRKVQTGERTSDEEGGAAPRWSPDPFVATDRYRLTMPYADRI